MEVMNYYDYEGGVEKVSRRFVRKKIGSKICEEEEEDASRKQKRASPFCSSVHESSQKVKKVKPGSQRRYVSCDSYKKVDNNNNSLNGYYDEMEKRKRKRISEPNDESDTDSDQCSVGSCSVVPNPSDDNSDGESLNISSDDVAVSIHRLELHAYRSTLEALYASGPLSWEKEALLTNLRINLHISNDEHLIELRHLISSGVN